MKNKILKISLIIFSLLFLVFPLSYGISNLRILILSLFVLLIFLFAIKKLKYNISEKYYIYIIIGLGILTRIGVIFLLKNDFTQVSDFATALKASFDLEFQGDYYRVFTHWIIYPTIINFLYKIFGEFQIIAYLSNAAILILVSVIIYKLGVLIFGNKKYGFYVSLIYILWPANILYTMIFTQEHLCALLLLLALYLFLKIVNSNFTHCINILLLILVGVLLGISTFLKNFALVFIIAFTIFELLNLLAVKFSLKYILKKIGYLFIIIISFSFTRTFIFIGIDTLVKNEVARNIAPCYLNVGLRDNGVYSDKNYTMYFDKLKLNNYDYDQTNTEITKELINYWKEEKSISDFIYLIDYKANIIFGNDTARISWVNSSLINNNVNNYILKINNLYFVCLCVLMAIGLIYMLKTNNLLLFLCYLIFFGSMLLLLLVEAQNRYMYSIQTLMCILSIPGIKELKKISKDGFNI